MGGLKKKRKLVLSIISLATICIITSNIQAQVCIGSSSKPIAGTLLEIKDRDAISPISVTDATNITSVTGGLGLPRVHLVSKTTLEPFIPSNSDWENDVGCIKEKYAGLMVYNIKVSDADEADINKQFQPGIYIWDGSCWQHQGDAYRAEQERFFSLQPFDLPLDTRLASQNFDLYEEYKKQFSKNASGPFISNNPALQQILSGEYKHLYAPDELDFVVTFYDDDIITVTGIDPSGKMSYTAKKSLHKANPKILMNVVLVVK